MEGPGKDVDNSRKNNKQGCTSSFITSIQHSGSCVPGRGREGGSLQQDDHLDQEKHLTTQSWGRGEE